MTHPSSAHVPSCALLVAPLFVATSAHAATTIVVNGPRDDDKKVEVIELAPRTVRATEPAPAPVDEPAPVEMPAEAPSLASQLPFTLAISGTTTYQTLDGADGAHDYLVGYLDMVIESELWEGTNGVVEWESIGGNGPDSDVPSFAGTLFGWNANGGSAQDDGGFDRFYLAEAFISCGSIADDWVFDLGKIASTSYIDTVRVANDSVGQFLSGSFCNASALQAPFRGGGIAASYVGSERFDFRALAMRPDNGADQPTSHMFGAVQGGVHWNQDERTGSCSLYCWSNGSRNDQTGVGLVADQDIGKRVTGFTRFTWQDDEDTVPDSLETSWSLGFELRDGFTGRESDLFAAAVGLNSSHDSALDDETVYETYYKRVFNEHCQGSIHLQGMNHPGGDPSQDTVTALALRLVISL